MKVYDLGTTTWFQLTPTVANQNNINTVAAISADITQAATDSADIQTVAADSADIQTLADIEDGTVATNAISNAGTNTANITTVAGQISPTNNIATVASVSADITSVAGQISPTNNIQTVANANANITTVAADLAGSNNIGTVATDIANVNFVGTDIANVNIVASNISDVNNFADTYFISATAPSSPTLGDLWFDTTNNVMKVYGSGGFVTAASSINGTANRYKFTATSGQTTFTVDDDGNNLAYDAPYLDTYLNGVKLVNNSDFTATSGTSIVLASGAATNDILEVVAYGTFELANFSINDANDVSTAGITDGQVLTWNASSSTFQAGNASSAEVYGFNKDASGNLIVTTTNGGNDNISNATYATFDDVLFAASGFTFSLSNGDLIATI